MEISFLSLYQNAHIVVKIVIYILTLFSVISWCVFVAKVIGYERLAKSIKKQRQTAKNLKSLSNANFEKNSLGEAFVKEIKSEIDMSMPNLDLDIKKRIKNRLEIKTALFVSESKFGSGILASIGSSAPFIGLFGTVWGVMDSFIGIASQNSASLAVVAPGIAEALFATAIGLAAAIPAVLFYNYIIKKNANLSVKVGEIATLLLITASRDISKAKND